MKQDKSLPICLDLGSGVAPFESAEYDIIHLDSREDMKPKSGRFQVCDIRCLPFDDCSVDAIYAAHVLEHFSFREIYPLMFEWLRVVKTKGEVAIKVPNLDFVFKQILKENDISLDMLSQIYGWQDCSEQFHKCGFNANSLRKFMGQFSVTGRYIVSPDGRELIFDGKKF
jgi:SAM-dependent methyltransferase